MLIREVEKLTGIKDVNIRYYEKEGLIHPERKSNGYREYSEEDVQRIRQIKTLRLLDIPVPVIKKVLSGEISLQEVMKKRLLEVSEEESRIREIKNSCEAIIAGDIHIDELSEEMLCGNRATWKARLEEIMKQDIDKRFIGKGFLYIIVWAVLMKLLITAFLCPYTVYEGGSLGAAFLETLNLHETGMDIYFVWGIGIFLLLYGIGLSIFEGLSGKDFLWVWGRNWSGGGLGGLANSFTFCGIGVAFLGTTITRFAVLLLAVCILLSVIRGVLMYLQSERRRKPLQKTGRVMVIVVLICILLFALSILVMRNDYISKNPVSDTKDQRTEYEDGTVLEITSQNWEDYFDLMEAVKYEKNENGEVTGVYRDVWFALKEEYWNRVDQNAENEVTFICRIDVKLKKYEIIDPKTGDYKITGDGPKGLFQPQNNRGITFWDNENNGVEEEAPLVERYDGDEPYMYTYDELEVRAAEGKIYLKEK